MNSLLPKLAAPKGQPARRACPALLLIAALTLTACGGGGDANTGTGGNTSTPNGGTPSADTEKPVLSSLKLAAPTGGSVVLQALARDNVGVSGYCFRSDDTLPAAGDACFRAAAEITVDVPAGHQTWRVHARDAAGNVSAKPEVLLLDLRAPTVSAVTPVSLASGKVNVRITASDSHGVSAVCLRAQAGGSGATTPPLPSDGCFTTGDTVGVTAVVGPVIYRAYARDLTGNVSAGFETSLDAYAALDTGKPSVTGVAVRKVDGQVELTATAIDDQGVSGYCFRTDRATPPEACYTPEPKRLVPAPATYQEYTIHVRDHAGLVSAPFIHRLDVAAPVVQGVVTGAITATQVSVNVSARTDDEPSAYCLRPRANRDAPAVVPAATDPCFITQSTVVVAKPIDIQHYHAYVRDAAGNVSAPYAYTLDMGSPSVLSVTLGLTVAGQVPVTATAVDGAGVTAMCLRTDNTEPAASDACFISTTAGYTVTHPFSVPAPTAATTVKVYARDAAGNVSLGSPLSFGYCASTGTVGILPKVCVVTTLGEFVMELDNVRAPISANNILKYVDDGFFTDTQFHRIMSSFMVQGGGFTAAGVAKTATYAAITLEKTTTTGLSNTVGTVAMARTSVLNSGTSQFFINVVDNTSKLDSTSSNDGYAVFGKIISGMDTTVQLIRAVPVQSNGGELSKPLDSPRILRATRLR